MKQVSLVTAIFLLAASPAGAVEFNKDALKTIQEEGHKIAAEALGARTFKTSNGLCLDYAGRALLVKKCKSTGSTQGWYFDEQGRLVASDGRCVAGAQLANCGSGKGQKWKLDGNKRLANQNKQCLQVPGNPPKAGAKLKAAACSGAANQVWQ